MKKKIDDQILVDWLREESKDNKLIARDSFYKFIMTEFDIWQPYRILKKLRDIDKIIVVTGRYIKYVGFQESAL